MKRTELITEYCDEMPKEKKEGILYISEKYEIAIHLCACGCGIQSVTPLKRGEWALTKKNPNMYDETVTLRPSIGNFKGEPEYHAHYYITDNKIEWL